MSQEDIRQYSVCSIQCGMTTHRAVCYMTALHYAWVDHFFFGGGGGGGGILHFGFCIDF